jgi:hypothetical protein
MKVPALHLWLLTACRVNHRTQALTGFLAVNLAVARGATA